MDEQDRYEWQKWDRRNRGLVKAYLARINSVFLAIVFIIYYSATFILWKFLHLFARLNKPY